MPFANRLQYYRRILAAYLGPGVSQLTFWHETPQANPNATTAKLGEYYMKFFEKADYTGHHDSTGIPILDYHGQIGLQYNPIAIAQWGLGNHNLFCRTAQPNHKERFLLAANWLVTHLEQNSYGVWVWNHHFDWEYRTPLRAPWYSGLAQGQGISLLVRAHAETGDRFFLQAAERAFVSLRTPIADGGVIFTDDRGDRWIEEYIVSPPTHILNGFLWATWGIHDFSLATSDNSVRALFEQFTQTLIRNLDSYDLGFWSLYEHSGTRLPMVASPFYHQLHVVQLRVMQQLTGNDIFARYADRWESYAHSRAKRTRALCYKSAFKLCYY
jgi:heparosan-N-sulfate-glucuronate 5-epimerase